MPDHMQSHRPRLILQINLIPIDQPLRPVIILIMLQNLRVFPPVHVHVLYQRVFFVVRPLLAAFTFGPFLRGDFESAVFFCETPLIRPGG